MGLMHGGGGGGAGYAPPRFLEGQPGGQLSLQVRYQAQPGYQPQPYRHQPPASLTVSTSRYRAVPKRTHSFCIVSPVSVRLTPSFLTLAAPDPCPVRSCESDFAFLSWANTAVRVCTTSPRLDWCSVRGRFRGGRRLRFGGWGRAQLGELVLKPDLRVVQRPSKHS